MKYMMFLVSMLFVGACSDDEVVDTDIVDSDVSAEDTDVVDSDVAVEDADVIVG